MQYFITFLEGIISFISPCMLPLLPIYISYFMGDSGREEHVLMRAVSFFAGFTVIFCTMGVFAGTLGSFFAEYRTGVNIACGVMVILFGLSYLEIIPIRMVRSMGRAYEAGSMVKAFLFGVIYSVTLTPCVGAFLGSALLLAAS